MNLSNVIYTAHKLTELFDRLRNRAMTFFFSFSLLHLQKEELRLQQRGYPITFLHTKQLVEEVRQLLVSRAFSFLPGEHHSLLKPLRRLLFDVESVPVSLGVFMEALQEIIDKFNPLYAAVSIIHTVQYKRVMISILFVNIGGYKVLKTLLSRCLHTRQLVLYVLLLLV